LSARDGIEGNVSEGDQSAIREGIIRAANGASTATLVASLL